MAGRQVDVAGRQVDVTGRQVDVTGVAQVGVAGSQVGVAGRSGCRMLQNSSLCILLASAREGRKMVPMLQGEEAKY